jgi:Dyp-type peroxidase family
MAPARLELADVQGNVLRPFAYPLAAYAFLEVTDRTAAAAWLRATASIVTTAEPWDEKPDVTRTIAFTAVGLRAIGVPRVVLDSFPAAFTEGLVARAAALGDTGPSAPAGWDPPHPASAHILVTLHTRNFNRLGEEVEALRAGVGRHGLAVHHVEPAHRLLEGREHFGFVDGMGQPAIAGFSTAPPAQGSPPSHWWQRGWQPLAVGEFLHGHPDNDGVPGPAPAAPFDRNGTFLVYRKLAQDVAGFRAHVADQATRRALDAELVAAKLVGRWRDGTPLVTSPNRPDEAVASDAARVNDFSYADDGDGYRCPIGAHVRRANPRDALGFGGAITGRHRMLRRGMPYGPPLDEGAADDGQDRGLIFVAYVADLVRQFEFVQAQWCNDGNAFGLGADCDGVLGSDAGSGKMTVQSDPPWFVSPLGRFVTTRAGAYLYTPGLRALRWLADGETP